jgi:hypothetical protein
VNLTQRVRRLEAYRDIRALACAYGRYLDGRDIEALLHLYVEEVRETLLETMVPALHRVRTTILHTGTHVINFDDETHATGLLYCHGEIENAPGSFIHQAIWYSDLYECREGRWFFAKPRRHELVYGAPVGARPQNLPPANWPQNDTGVGTMPYRLESWQQFWKVSETNS